MEYQVQEEEQERHEWNDLERQVESPEHIEQDRFTSLMFGPRREPHSQHHQEPVHNQSTIDYEELMVNIDNLMKSVRGLKPLFQKVYPFIEQFWKKE